MVVFAMGALPMIITTGDNGLHTAEIVRSFCDQLLPNPFYQVPGFEGTTRFTRRRIGLCS